MQIKESVSRPLFYILKKKLHCSDAEANQIINLVHQCAQDDEQLTRAIDGLNMFFINNVSTQFIIRALTTAAKR